MDKKNLAWSTILLILIGASNAATVILGKDHIATQVIEIAAKTGCQLAQDIERVENQGK